MQVKKTENLIEKFVRPIKTKKDYTQTLKAIEGLMNAKRNTPEGDTLDVLVTLVQAYEEKHFPIKAPNAVELVKFLMEQNNLRQIDLAKHFGNRQRVSEFLKYKRRPTMDTVWSLHKTFNAPLDSLVRPYELVD